MTKIAYNACYGGFSLSHTAMLRYTELANLSIVHDKHDDLYICKGKYFPSRDISRTDPYLIQVIEELKSDANGPCANLAIRELPPGTKYRIDEYDGYESVKTIDEYEWSVA